MLSIPKALSLKRRKPVVIPTEQRVEKPCYQQQNHQTKAYLFKAMVCQTPTRTHYQKMLLTARKRVFQTGITIKPEEWRLPKAPVPSRPDFSRCLIGKPVRNFSTDAKMPNADKEYGIQGYMDPVLMLVPNIQFDSVFPHSVPEQCGLPKLYTPICNQKILHEKQPHIVYSSQKEENTPEDENLTKANFEDYQQVLSADERMESVSEGSMLSTGFREEGSDPCADFGTRYRSHFSDERRSARQFPTGIGYLGRRNRHSSWSSLATLFCKVQMDSSIIGHEPEIQLRQASIRAPVCNSYVGINSFPQTEQRNHQKKMRLQKNVRLAKSLRFWITAPKYGRRNGRPHQSKNEQKNHLEVTGNSGTLFNKNTAKKEKWPKRKITRLKKKRPQLKIEIHKCFGGISEDISITSGLNENGVSMESTETLSQMEKSLSLPDLTRLNEEKMPQKKICKQKDSRTKKHRKPRFQPKFFEEAEAPITPEELQEIDEPRDFLTQYCIIHPNRLSIYERVFQKSVSKQTPKFTRNIRLLPQQAPLALREVSIEEGPSESYEGEGSEELAEDDGLEEEEEEEEEEEDEEEEGNDDDADDDEEEAGSEEQEEDDDEEEEDIEEEESKQRSPEEASEVDRTSDSVPITKTIDQNFEGVEIAPRSTLPEKKICQETSFVFKREHSDIGLTMPERSLRKLNATRDILIDDWNDLVAKKAKVEDKKTQRLIDKARELFPQGMNDDENQEQHVSLHTVVMEVCGFNKPEEMTDEYILRHLTGSKMEKTKEQLSNELHLMDTEIEILQNKMQLISKDMQMLEDVTEKLQTYCYEYFTFGPPDTRPISPRFRRQQSFTYDKLHPEKDVELNFSELEPTLQHVNKQLLTKKHCQYIYYILKISECCRINFRFFCVLAALSEKVTQLEPIVQNLMEKLDFDALDIKIKRSKELFNLLRTDDLLPGDLTTVTNLSVELAAGGVNPSDAALVLRKLSRDAAGYIDFLDFLTYLPLFVEIHQKIIQDPLHPPKSH